MKELSIEEKAKAYDKALERVKNIKTGKCKTTFVFTEGLFEYIFPELAENEQESAYIEFIKAAIEDYYDENNPLRKELVAWLEKQGEQILANTAKNCKDEQMPAWSEEDKVGLDDALWCCKQAASIAKDENDMGNAWYAENWLKSLKKRIGG